MYRARLRLLRRFKSLSVHKPIRRVFRQGFCGARNIPKGRHFQHQEGWWDYVKRQSHCCGEDAAGVTSNILSLKLEALGESSPVVDDIVM